MADALSTPVLTTTRYVPPDVYLGELIQPNSANLSVDARIPAIIARGDRLAIASNQGILRAFIFGQQLAFSSSPPYLAPLQKVAVGQLGSPNRIYKQDGTEVPAYKWQYVLVSGQYAQVQIADDVFDQTATYLIDYQSSDRSVQDVLPIQEVRQLTAVGNQLDRAQYIEYTDYFVPFTVTEPVADEDNANPLASFSSIVATTQPGSTGVVTYDSGNEFDHNYSRQYTITCSAVTGTSPTRVASFTWAATLQSNGVGAVQPVPLSNLDVAPSFTVDESNPASEQQDLELGIKLDFAFGATNFVVGDEFIFTAFGPALIEVDPRYSNPQFAQVNAPEVVSGTANDYAISINPNTAYLLTRNNNYVLKLKQIAGSTPNRQLTFLWARFGETTPVATGSFTVLENNFTTHTQDLANGIKVDFVIGANDAVIGTEWQISATAPRIYYTAKDSRQYKLTIGGITSPASNDTLISGGFSTNTTEGKFGTFTAEYNSATGSPDGYALMPDNMSLAFRNMSQFAVTDVFTFGVTVSDFIDWSLQKQVTDVREVTDYLTDQNGGITGTAGQKYVILTNVPSDAASVRVQNINTGADISFNFIVGTQFVYFTTFPNVPLKITYLTAGAEPDPGAIYYVTASFLRPDAYYNIPFLVLRVEDGRSFAAPSTVQNDLFIGNEIAWTNGVQALYLVQPKNVDGSGTYTITDFQPAISSLDGFDRITDVCLLNFVQSLPDVLNQNVEANDPFNKRANMVWVGMPIGTPIGDDNTDGSLVFTSKVTLQVNGESAAKGTRVLVGNNRATKSIVLQDGTTSTVVLDGSFLALAMAARVASFADPATDVLQTQVAGFDTIDLYMIPENNILGGANINYINGSSAAYFWAEDITTDTTENFDRIQLMTQRMYVTKVVVRNLKPIIGVVPGSTEAAIELIRGSLAAILRGLLAAGLIGQYQDDTGNERSFDPGTDIIVVEDETDDSKFYYNFAWFSRNVIKRLFGLYALNSSDLQNGVVLE